MEIKLLRCAELGRFRQTYAEGRAGVITQAFRRRGQEGKGQRLAGVEKQRL